MKAVLFTLLLLLPPNYSDAACLEAVPFKELGVLKIGDPVPKKIGHAKVVKDGWTTDHHWFESGNYRFRTNDQDKIDLIQFSAPNPQFCYVVGGNKIMASRSVAELARDFPHCQFERREGGDVLVCDGISFLHGDGKKVGGHRPLRIDIENRTLHALETERAGQHVKYILRSEWPFRQGLPLPGGP